MKVNEAPEKIFLERILCSNEVYGNWKSQKTISDDIEYTRTDAFIEKACTYWYEKAIEAEGEVEYYIMSCIEDFKNYMKGE